MELKHGWFGVKCRSGDDIKDGVTIAQCIVNEAEYFKSHVPYSTMDQGLFGTQNLSIKLRELFEHSMKKDLPGIYMQVKNKMETL